MNERGIAKANYFGYSMGGYVALAVASRFPNMADRIVTLGTKLAWDRSTAEKEVLNLNPVVLEAKVPLYSEKLKALHTAIGWIKVLQLTADFMKSLGESPMREAEFASIKSPVLILTGEKDKMVSATESLAVAELMPNGRSTVLSGMPHPFEQVDENVLKDVVLDFLK
jgi:pimeloyl-ACP methyl ester carboxylesterase